MNWAVYYNYPRADFGWNESGQVEMKSRELVKMLHSSYPSKAEAEAMRDKLISTHATTENCWVEPLTPPAPK
jgi:hypothetical protein